MDKFTEKFVRKTAIKKEETQAKRDYFQNLLTQNSEQNDQKKISDGRAAALLNEIEDRSGFAFQSKINQEADQKDAASKLMLFLIFLIWTRLDEDEKTYLTTQKTLNEGDLDYEFSN